MLTTTQLLIAAIDAGVIGLIIVSVIGRSRRIDPKDFDRISGDW